MGIMAGSDVEATFRGDESLSKRPMRKLFPLLKTGAIFREQKNNSSNVKGSKIPLPLRYKPSIFAQIKSCILLCGLSSLGKQQYRTIPIKRSYRKNVKFLGAKVKTTQLKI